MKLHILSDLHLGCCPLEPAPVIADVLVLAGDITDGRHERLFDFAQHYLRRNRPVLFTPGNHEFYGHSLARALAHFWRECRRRGVELLHNRAVVIDGVRFAGAPLWTDFELEGRPSLSATFARQGMADFTYISHRGRSLTPAATVRFHRRTLRFLERVFAQPFKGETVVVTHHGPHPRSIHPRFANHPLNPGFASNLTAELERWAPAYWIHGHVHNRLDYQVARTRIVVNPRGYVGQHRLANGTVLTRREHDEFDPRLVLEI